MTEPRLHLRGVVLPGGAERDVFVGGDRRISFDAAAGDARTVAEGVFLLPGLVDAHAHLTIGANLRAVGDEGVRVNADANVAAGVLLVREPGGASHATAGAAGSAGAPRLQSAGRWLAARDAFLPGWGREVAEGELAGAAVDELTTAGGGWAKVIGDWRRDDVFRPSFSADALAAATRAVHDAGGRIAIHAIMAETVEMAVSAGCDSIEHGTFASDEAVAVMASRGMALTPTIGAVLEPPPPGAPAVVRERAAAAATTIRTTVRKAWEAGATLMAGTDITIPHGEVRREIELLASSGIPAEAALAAGSWGARAFLGLPGIEEGAPADLVAFVRDPREDLATLADPVIVVLDGGLIPGGEPA